MTITEVKTAWTVHYALRNKAFKWVHQALEEAISQLPISVIILHADNGTEFINESLLAWCKGKGIILARSRNKKKNDNCFVEQKNAASVRKIIGYARYCEDAGVSAIQAVYTHYDKLHNFFYPGRKLISRERVGSKVKKKYDNPQTPYERILAEDNIPQEHKENLMQLKSQIDLITEMTLMNQALDKLCASAVPVPQFVSKRYMKPLRFGSRG